MRTNCAPSNSPIVTQRVASASLPPRCSRFLISSRPGLEIELTPSQQKRKHFLISSFSGISALAPHRNSGPREFLIATHRIQKIANQLKLNEKRFSNRNTQTLGSIGNLVNRPAGRFILRSRSAGSKGLCSSVLDWRVGKPIKASQMRRGKIAYATREFLRR
jgi:hypothetical protein